MTKHKLSLFLALAFVTACNQEPAATSQPDFSVGGASPSECGPITEGAVETIGCLIGTVGHEHMVRIAETRAHAMTGSDLYTQGLIELASGSGGDSSKDDLVIGNYSTDKPIFTQDFDLAQWHADLFGVGREESWHESGKRQMFHSLVNFAADDHNPRSLVSRQENCKAIQNVMETQTRKGLELVAAGRKKEGMRLIGSVTHTIQDSFSRAHTVRATVADVDDGKFFKYRVWSLDKFCKYGKAVPGVCEHALSHDFISELGPMGGPFKPEARAATDTTTAYLVYVHWMMKNTMSVKDGMADFFNGSSRFLAFAKDFYTKKQERTVVTVGNFQCTE